MYSGKMSTRSVLSSGLDGKDVVIVATREELASPSKVSLPEPEPTPGLILADGSINWGCPCLGGMATGPCGSQFREAFSCFHYRYIFLYLLNLQLAECSIMHYSVCLSDICITTDQQLAYFI